MENNNEYEGLTEAEIAVLKEVEAEEVPDKDVEGEEANDNRTGASGGMEEQKAPSTPETFEPIFAEVDQDKLDSLKAELDEAKQKFEDGDIDYFKLDEAKDAYNELKWTSDFAQESNRNMRDGRWKLEQNRFLDDNSQYKSNESLNAAFVATVNNLIASDEGSRMSDMEVLLRAKEQVEAALRGLDSTSAPSVAEDNTTHHADEFAHLDKLEGAAYQEAIDSLSRDQLTRYEDL